MSNLAKPTAIERFVQLIPLKYSLAALAWVLLLGPVSFSLVQYLTYGNAFYYPAPINAFLGSILLLYGFYIIRYVRLRVLAAESQVSQIVAGGNDSFQSIFGRVTSTRSIAILTIILEIVAFLATLPMRTLSLTSAFDLIGQVILITTFSTLIWEYSAASWGLHKLGRSQLSLRSFLEDRFMGARPIGNLALSLTTAYLGGILLFFLDTLTFLLPLSTNLAVFSFYGFYLTLLSLGVVLFFLPLNSLHKRLQAEKANHLRELGLKLSTILQTESSGSMDGSASIASVQKGINELVMLKDFEITERKLATTPTWPFDVQVIARLITIVLSVTAVLLSRFITDYLIPHI